MYRKIKMGEEKYLMVCHATPESTWEKVCASDVPTKDLRRAYGKIEAEVIAYGHYHKNHVIQIDGKILVNVASVGMRKDGMSAYSIVEYVDDKWIVEQYQVKYDETEERRLEKEKKFPRVGEYRGEGKATHR